MRTNLISNTLNLILLSGVGLLLAGGCVLKPAEASNEPERLERAARQQGYETDRIQRTPLPELPEDPDWRAILRLAFLANGELESRFYDWAMAVHRIDQAGSWPSQPVELGFEYMFSGERMKTFDRMTFSAGLMRASVLPGKSYESARVAWRDAQAAGERFRAAKFSLQKQVLQAWADYSLQAERVRIQEENVRLLRLVANAAASRVRAGAAQQEQLRADVTLRLTENELATICSELDRQRITLNALLRRGPQMPLEPPDTLPQSRRVLSDDDALLAAGVSNNAELAALGFDRDARLSAIKRARQEYWPEINPMAAFAGSVSQSIGAAIVLPTQLPRIRAMIAEARADLRRVQAGALQARTDRAAQFAMAVLAMRDAERRSRVFEFEIIPLAVRTVELSRRGYSAGTVGYLDLIEAQRTLLDGRVMLAEAYTAREKRLAEIEELAGVDLEVIDRGSESTTRPTTRVNP